MSATNECEGGRCYIANDTVMLCLRHEDETRDDLRRRLTAPVVRSQPEPVAANAVAEGHSLPTAQTSAPASSETPHAKGPDRS